mmetsp:Transcript_31315/g.68778  ORF Transcript_31315/g.68778 Transcript_31315/m.68778 type:complete len:152 (+) Transcript_31315:415-870(+)
MVWGRAITNWTLAEEKYGVHRERLTMAFDAKLQTILRARALWPGLTITMAMLAREEYLLSCAGGSVRLHYGLVLLATLTTWAMLEYWRCRNSMPQSLQVLTSAAVAADRAGNERAVDVSKRAGMLSRGVRPSESIDRTCNLWLAWSFQANT